MPLILPDDGSANAAAGSLATEVALPERVMFCPKLCSMHHSQGLPK